MDPQGHKTTIAAKVRQISQDLWRCEYMSTLTGLHSINIFYAGKPISKSPYGVRVAPTSDPKKVRASGRGLQPTGVRIGDVGDFKIHTEGAGEGLPEVTVIGPGGVSQKVQMKKINGTTYEIEYIPIKEGRYVVMVVFAGQEIAKSPFEVTVGPKKESSIVAFGPGLTGGVVGYPAAFVVETNGETGALGFSVAGPSQAEIECCDNLDGSALVKYHPTAPGEYAVHILCDNEDIPKSPHIATVLPRTDFHPELVKAYGSGIQQKNGVTIGKTAEFTVDTKLAGSAPLEVKIQDVYGIEVPAQLKEKPDGTKVFSYTPKSVVPHTIEINYGGVATPNSPHRVYIAVPLDPTKIQVFGPWLEPGVKPNVPTHFNVDAREAGDADLEVHLIHDQTNKEVPVRIIDNEDNTFSVEVIAPETGSYTANLIYGGLKVPVSPKVHVKPIVDVSKVKVDGLEPSKLSLIDFYCSFFLFCWSKVCFSFFLG